MKPSASNLTESGTPRSPATRCGCAAVGIDAPDLVGAHHREVQQAVRADLHRVGRRQVLHQHPRRARRQVEFHQAAAVAAFADEQPVLMNGDAVGARHVVAQHPGAAGGVAHADPAVHDLGGVQVAVGIEGDVVGRDDVAALGADGLQLPGVDIERADLAAGHLRDIDAAVRAGAQTVGAEQPAGRGEPFQAPARRRRSVGQLAVAAPRSPKPDRRDHGVRTLSSRG